MKDGDTFYYILKQHHTSPERDDWTDYSVYEYRYDSRWHKCFDKSRMFLDRAAAEKKARELNG